MDAPDPIFSARNLFYLGGYREAIDDASTLAGLTEEQEVERDYFVYRSYIELGETEVRRGVAPPRADLRRRRWASIAPGRGRRGRSGTGGEARPELPARVSNRDPPRCHLEAHFYRFHRIGLHRRGPAARERKQRGASGERGGCRFQEETGGGGKRRGKRECREGRRAGAARAPCDGCTLRG